MLQAIDLTMRYEDGNLALDHLNLEVGEGQIFCLLGANGAGKTTTINLFLNFIDPTEGTALINGIDVTRNPLDIFRAKEIADYVGIMKEGRLVMVRSRDEFLEDNLETIYLDYMKGIA